MLRDKVFFDSGKDTVGHWSMYVHKLRYRQMLLQQWYEVNELTNEYPKNYGISYPAWNAYNGHDLPPVNAGFLEQPAWIFDDFGYYALKEEYFGMDDAIYGATKSLERAQKRAIQDAKKR